MWYRSPVPIRLVRRTRNLRLLPYAFRGRLLRVSSPTSMTSESGSPPVLGVSVNHLSFQELQSERNGIVPAYNLGGCDVASLANHRNLSNHASIICFILSVYTWPVCGNTALRKASGLS